MKEYTDSLTVAELIQELQQLHQSYRVCVRGCDGIGVYDITQIIPDERGFIEICTLNSEQHIVPCECGHGKDQHNSLETDNAAIRKVAQKLFERQHSLWKTHWEMAQSRGVSGMTVHACDVCEEINLLHEELAELKVTLEGK